MPSKPPPIITLTTDFGSSDYFVGAMKGVMLGIAPAARLVDISHAISPYNVNEGAFVVSEAWCYFPKGTIHVAVVDPGVGSARRPIVVEAGGHYFVGPDNGVFSLVYDATKPKVREITNGKLMLPKVSRTFHGRDVFAPAAAHLARRIPVARFGKQIHDFAQAPKIKPMRSESGAWTGTVLKVDHFGNLVTNFHVNQFDSVKTRPIELRVAGQTIRRFALTYADTEIGEMFVVVGSSGYLEIAANQANAAELLGSGVNAPVELQMY
jgi:S-adenosyl-L-methionine hydrolase (adenosine-forming)